MRIIERVTESALSTVIAPLTKPNKAIPENNEIKTRRPGTLVLTIIFVLQRFCNIRIRYGSSIVAHIY